MEKLVEALLEHETVDGAELEKLVREYGVMGAPVPAIAAKHGRFGARHETAGRERLTSRATRRARRRATTATPQGWRGLDALYLQRL